MMVGNVTSFTDHMKHVSLAKTQEDFYDAMYLRYLHICKWNNYEEDQGDPYKSIGDKHDKYSDYIIHRDDEGEVNGALRLIRPNEHGFFMERYFSLSDYIDVDQNTLELCELVTHEDHRMNFLIIGRILIRLGKYLLDKDVKSAAAISIDAMHPVMMKLGFQKTGNEIMTGWNKKMTLFYTDRLDDIIENIIDISPSMLRPAIADYYGK